MKVKRSKNLVLLLNGDHFIGQNLLSGIELNLPMETAKLLLELDVWTSIDLVVSMFREFFQDETDLALNILFDADFLIRQGQIAEQRENKFSKDWKLCIPSALLHFSTTRRAYLSEIQLELEQVEKAKCVPRPELYSKVETSKDRKLHRVSEVNEDSLVGTMCRRRTLRDCPNSELQKMHLFQILFSGLGITGWSKNSIGKLPLKMAPSGGAMNPFEAYALVLRVEGIDAGIYQYFPIDGSLQFHAELDDISASQLLGNQEWADNGACIIFLCADLSRPMWKYEYDDNVYKAALIEAGHIAQNMMLVGTQFGYSLCPTIALSHEQLHEKLGLDGIVNSAMYAVCVNEIAKYDGEDAVIEQNSNFEYRKNPPISPAY